GDELPTRLQVSGMRGEAVSVITQQSACFFNSSKNEYDQSATPERSGGKGESINIRGLAFVLT
ncbi:hypothetical protein ABTA63_19460, partial [Acinetobacter baumannii]